MVLSWVREWLNHNGNSLFILLEAGERWAPGETFTTRHLSILQDRNDNRHEAHNWSLSSVDSLNNGDDRIRGGGCALLGQNKEVTSSPSSRSGRPQLHMRRETPLGQKGRGCQAIINLDNFPTMLCFGIYLGQKMHMHIRGGP